jgi:hypothetical protein
MKKFVFGIFIAICFASCTTQKPLYSWHQYNTASYNYLKNANEKSTQQLIETYQKIIEKQKGTRNSVPPGIYADYGFILLQANKTKEGKAMLMKEIELYPESQLFINRIFKLIEE